MCPLDKLTIGPAGLHLGTSHYLTPSYLSCEDTELAHILRVHAGELRWGQESLQDGASRPLAGWTDVVDAVLACLGASDTPHIFFEFLSLQPMSTFLWLASASEALMPRPHQHGAPTTLWVGSEYVTHF